jgi:hypothetical protein
VKIFFFNFTYAKEESSFIRTLLESCMSYLCKSGTLKDTVKDTKLKCTKAAEQSVSHRKKEGDTDADWPASMLPYSLLEHIL